LGLGIVTSEKIADGTISAIDLGSTTISDKLGFTPANSVHNHIISDVTGLDTALLVHTHSTSAITGLDTALSNKQATLVSGTSIKTLNNASILGSGNLAVGTAGTNTSFDSVSCISDSGTTIRQPKTNPSSTYSSRIKNTS
jgi:hypothetical protein